MLAPIYRVTLPTPAGGKYPQIMVDIDPVKLLSKGLTPLQVVNAVTGILVVSTANALTFVKDR